MLRRCNEKTNHAFYLYGGRGVTVCDRWDPAKGGCFENFLADMGERPEGTSIDKDKLGNGMLYSPGTCCWLTQAEQVLYRRDTMMFTVNGKRMPITYAAKALGKTYLATYKIVEETADRIIMELRNA